jgi:uncharacterized protein Yka (UPF0111/DUF47 family)
MNFFRKKADFYALLMSQAEKVLEGVRALREYASHQGPERARKVRDLEKEADEERRVLIAELNRTFATPIDREDIPALPGPRRRDGLRR